MVPQDINKIKSNSAANVRNKNSILILHKFSIISVCNYFITQTNFPVFSITVMCKINLDMEEFSLGPHLKNVGREL